MTRRIERDPHDPDYDYWWSVEDTPDGREVVPRYKFRDGKQRLWYGGETVTPERVALWADLLAHPDEASPP